MKYCTCNLVSVGLIAFAAQLSFAQEGGGERPAGENSGPVEVRFEDANYRLYCGYVNPVEFSVLSVTGKHPRMKFQAIAREATIEYDDQGIAKILPTSPDVRIRVYAEIKDKVYWVGDIPFKCVNASSDGSIDKELKKKLEKPVNYTLTGKDVIKSFDFFVRITGAIMSELKEAEENRVTLVVTQKYGEYYRRFLEDYNVQSDDAEVKKVSRLIFTVKPNPGVKNCKLNVSLAGEKVGGVTLHVVPK